MTKSNEMRGRSLVRRARFGLAAASVGVVALASACGQPPPPTSSLPNPLSRGTNSVLGNDHAISGSMSSSGNVVAFMSAASNLVPGDTNLVPDLFVRDLQSGQVARVFEGTVGPPVVRADGGAVAFAQNANGYFYDRASGSTTSWTAPGGSGVTIAAIGGNAVIYGFPSTVLGTSVTPSCRVHDVSTGADTACPSPSFAPSELYGASSNGRFVLYRSGGGSQTVLWDRQLGTTAPVDLPGIPSTGQLGQVGLLGGSIGISDDGSRIATIKTVGGVDHLVVHDLANSAELAPSVQPNGTSLVVGISPGGAKVLVWTKGSNLDATDTNGNADVYSWDLGTGDWDRLSGLLVDGSVTPQGAARCGVGPGQILDNGRACVMTPDALVSSDTNGVPDIYRVS